MKIRVTKIELLISIGHYRYEAKISNLTVKEIMNEISKLGELYESSFDMSDNYDQIIQLISRFYNNSFDIAKIMKRLTPECSRILSRCFFRDQQRNCSDIFAVGKTENGFCCIFNYILEMDDPPESPRQRESRIYFVGAIGVYNGLSVTLDPLLDDYFYPILATPGWKVMVFDPYDYPDTSSGSVSEILVAPLTEKYFRLEALGLHSSDNIRPYPMEQRGCIFPDERVTDYATYTNSYCIVDCKLMHIWNNCKCRPFFYPYREGFKKTCNVEDIDCLMKYYGKSYDIIPYKTTNWSIFVEDTNAIINCKDCYPDCDDMRYYFETSYSRVQSGVTNKMMFSNMTVTNHSVLHVYFQKVGTVFLKQDIYAYWYEQLSNVGGLYGFFVGFSIISLIEIIYFVGNCMIEICMTRVKKQDEIPRTNIIQPIYWNEFFSYSTINANREK
ncbi:Sodium channel protein Nach [Eufriesea mexicana]|uniref:Sodium channel protein Nach n=2 Tax=Eufriesea mexicana TaxID=516756 RepID=A0A310SJY6_9HYME|nr:Sodium channel protein Nach [Eufriesea mexicana]